MITDREGNGFMEEHAILSERLEDQLKAVEWARAEQKKILKELMDKMTPFILKEQKQIEH